ncbi:MAG: hypothetical protein JW759_08980 [Candidatus Coatesbacteria bacterium]|nr:hypothetical protein [Candidatus Coatesbacteria bacterium]
MTLHDVLLKPGYTSSRVIARVSDRMFVTSDGDLVDGAAANGESVVVFEHHGRGIESPTKVAGGLPVKEAIGVDDEAEPSVRFRLCLDGAEFEVPYSGWLGRLLVLENRLRGASRLFAVPHDPKYRGYKSAFGCHLIYASGLCRATAQCRNSYGDPPCEAPTGYACDRTFETCKDRRNFAPCPHTFGEHPCPALPSEEPCDYSARTCRALGRGAGQSFGDSTYAAFGRCKNTLSTCESLHSYLPFSPEFHVYCQPRAQAPFELSLHAAGRGRCVWLGQCQEAYDNDSGTSAGACSVSRVWVASNHSIRLPKNEPAQVIPTIPSSAIFEQMLATEGASGVGVADLSYSLGSPTVGSSHHLASVQWVTSSEQEDRPAACVVLNSSSDGESWLDDGEIAYMDSVEVAYDESAPTRPTRLTRTEYRVPRVVSRGGGDLYVYSLMGRVAFHNEVTIDGGRKRIYDEMFVELVCNGEKCTFEPPIIMDGYMRLWPEEPDGYIRLASDVARGELISTFWFRLGGAGSPTGVYDVALARGILQAFIPVRLVLGRRKGLAGAETVTVEALMRYISGDGVDFRNGTIVGDDLGHFLTCLNSVPVCRSWSGAECSRPDGFCGVVSTDGRFSSLYPQCDGQGTGGAPGGSNWSRYQPASRFRGPGWLDRAGVRSEGPPFALAGCNQRGAFACRLRKADYEGQWCARLACAGFQPQGLWGAGGIKVLDVYNDDL